jgi:hypothetical protein
MLAGVLVLSGCESKDAPVTPNPGTQNPTADDSGKVSIKTGNGASVTVDPTKGGTVVINRDNGKNNVASVVRAELKKCAEIDGSLVNTPGIACSPKEGVTYIFGTDYGRLGPVDNLPNTVDGGVLLKYAFTEFDGKKFPTPVEGNASENRIQEVFIPTNYIRLNDAAIAANLSVNEKYELIKKELEDVCNMKCQSGENANNPFFGVNTHKSGVPGGESSDGDGSDVTTGKFIATYVMHFTRGTGEKTLLAQYAAGNYSNLEYLTVSFELDVTKAAQFDDNGTMRDMLRYTSREGTPVVFGAKKHDSVGGGLVVVTENININQVANLTNVADSDDTWTINMAKYFNKLIAKGEAVGVADYAKAILVENATNPWPVKIYGTLHRVTESGGAYTNTDPTKRSYVRNPSNFDPHLFGLTAVGPHKDVYSEKAGNQAIKFNIVYPGGVYNKLD